MATDWAAFQAISAAAGFMVAAAPGVLRSARRLQVRARLKQNLGLAASVRESGQPSVELDPVLVELIAVNLAELAQLEGRRLRGRRSSIAWRMVQLVSIVGWGLAAGLTITHVVGLRQDAIGLVISTVVIDAPLLVAASILAELFRRRARRTSPTAPVRETPLERTHDLAAELVATLPLGRRDAIEELFSPPPLLPPPPPTPPPPPIARPMLSGTLWRTGRAVVPPR